VASGLTAALPGQNRSRIPAATVALRGSVSVQPIRLRLSDLLPASADQQLKQAASIVDLGQAPAPGSFRVFTSDELRRKGASKLGVQIPDKVVVRADGFPVEIDAVRRALAGYKPLPAEFTVPEISIPEEVVTRTKNAVLRVVRVEPGSDAHTAMAFVRCETRKDCGTFVVRLQFSDPVHWTGIESRPVVKTFLRAPIQNSLVRPGRRAALVLDEDGLRITVPVFPLRRAAMGESVRVLDKVSRRTYVARVCGEDQVTAHFEESQ
jgi:hypothetical protein